MEDLPYDLQNASKEAQDHYRMMVADGQNPRFAEMCALQMPPGTRGTDRAFMQGRYNGEFFNSMPPPLARRLIREAKAAGIDVSGKFYMGGLADKRGHMDPAAWVDSVADIKRVARERDLHVTGIVEHTPPERPPAPSVDISKDILREQVRREMKANPKLKRGEAVERVKDRIVPHWKRKKK